MPRLQILNRDPSFGERLGQGLGQGIGEGISGRVNQYLQQKQNKSALEGLRPFMEQLEFTPEQMDQFVNSAVPANIAAPLLGQIGQQFAAQKAQQQKIKAVEDKAAEKKKVAQDALNRMAEITPDLGFGSKVKAKTFGGETAEKFGEFESLTGALEAELVDRVSRGTLSNSRFKYITETLIPKPNDREAIIRGKLKALSQELDLDLPESLSKKDGLKKVEAGSKLTKETAAEIFKKAGNDPEKARKLAKQLGYEF